MMKFIVISTTLCVLNRLELSTSFKTSPFCVRLMLVYSKETLGFRYALRLAARCSKVNRHTLSVVHRGFLMKLVGQKGDGHTQFERRLGISRSRSILHVKCH